MKNAETNKATRLKKAAEEEEERKRMGGANKNTEKISDKAATITPRNLNNAVFGNDEMPNAPKDDDDDDIAAIMEIDGVDETRNFGDTSEMSPVKKRIKGKKRTSSRPSVSTPEPKSSGSTTKSASFLDEVAYKHSRIILELAIALKSDKAFKEFTQALMAFITNAQMVNPKFVINPISPTSKEKNICTKGGNFL